MLINFYALIVVSSFSLFLGLTDLAVTILQDLIKSTDNTRWGGSLAEFWPIN